MAAEAPTLEELLPKHKKLDALIKRKINRQGDWPTPEEFRARTKLENQIREARKIPSLEGGHEDLAKAQQEAFADARKDKQEEGEGEEGAGGVQEGGAKVLVGGEGS